MVSVTDDLRRELSYRAFEIVRHLLAAEPTNRSKRDVRFGRHGSFSVVISGPKQGSWFDHEAGEGGDMLMLIQRELRLDFGAAAEWGAAFVGHRVILLPKPHRHLQQEKLARKREAEAARESDDKAGMQKALAIWDACIPIYGTPAQHYLAHERAIPGLISSLTIRFHPGRHAVVFSVLEPSNAFVGIHVVRIGAQGQRLKGKGNKLSYGPVGRGAAVVFAEVNVTDIIVAEGPETGLSIAACTGLEVRCTLGTLNKYTPPAGRTVIAAIDDDPWGSPASLKGNEAIRNWRKRGLLVHSAHPWAERREDKSDFNDLLKSEGADAVLARIKVALPRPAVPNPSPLLEVDDARALLESVARRFFDV